MIGCLSESAPTGWSGRTGRFARSNETHPALPKYYPR
jgi:hypothetical protein